MPSHPGRRTESQKPNARTYGLTRSRYPVEQLLGASFARPDGVCCGTLVMLHTKSKMLSGLRPWLRVFRWPVGHARERFERRAGTRHAAPGGAASLELREGNPRAAEQNLEG
jgi:hypothetical protein